MIQQVDCYNFPCTFCYRTGGPPPCPPTPMPDDKKGGPPKGPRNKIDLLFRTPSGDATVEANLNQPLHVAYKKALHETGNDHLDPSEYYVQFGERRLDVDEKVGALGLANGDELRVRRKTSEGGSR